MKAERIGFMVVDFQWASAYFEKRIPFFRRLTLDLHKQALRLKIIEILDRYHKVQKQMHMMRQWKKIWVHPN